MTTATKTTPIATAAVARPPFGWILFSGKKAAGKTLASLNSPWQPVHIMDCENSSEDYFLHQARLQEMGLLRGEFTRDPCYTLAEYLAAATKIVQGKGVYGTIVIDTFGQVSNWVGEDQFLKDAKLADKQSQVVWGHIRDRIRKQLLELGKKCDLLVLTAHEREYPPMSKNFSPRCNPAVLELASISIRLVRQPNEKIPTGIVTGARLPFFAPQIKDFAIVKLLDYIQKPADWDKLKDDEKVTEAPAAALPGFNEARQYEEA